ncbi:MAG: hypothetical protein KF715_13815 [Candidatus Didemnitutus sp.]|nr:hypothetical protein [Candidatus Didemnitutus sp.]
MGALALGLRTSAQVAITSVDYGTTTNTTDRTAGNLTFLNQFTNVEYVSSSLGTYAINGTAASSVSFRRNTGAGNPNTANVFYQYSSTNSNNGTTTASVYGKGDSSPTLSEVMLSNDLTQGLRNPFANGSGSENSNIERIDFYFSGGYTVKENDAIVLFDLENYGDHGDGFRVAAYTSVGTVNGVSNAPTAYANSGLLVEPGTMGDAVDTPTGTNARYLLSTSTSGDSLTSNQSITSLDYNSGTPGANDLYLVGILIRFTDLGLSVGQTIYGYSLMAGDVTASSGSDLVNWNNSSVYSTDTDSSTWGNADFAAFGGTIARAVPESQFYGGALLSFGVLIGALHKRRRASRKILSPSR